MDEMKIMWLKIKILNTISIIGFISAFSLFVIMGYLANIYFYEWIKVYSIFDIHQSQYDFYSVYVLKYGFYVGIICFIALVCILYKKRLISLINRKGLQLKNKDFNKNVL
jgi:hypothetical protein